MLLPGLSAEEEDTTSDEEPIHLASSDEDMQPIVWKSQGLLSLTLKCITTLFFYTLTVVLIFSYMY